MTNTFLIIRLSLKPSCDYLPLLLDLSAQSIASRSAVPSTGLRKNPAAFISIAFRLVSGSSSPVTTMIERFMPRNKSSACNSSPDSPGILASSTTHPDPSELRASRNSFAESKVRTLWPATRNRRAIPFLDDGSSSTTNTLFSFFTKEKYTRGQMGTITS